MKNHLQQQQQKIAAKFATADDLLTGNPLNKLSTEGSTESKLGPSENSVSPVLTKDSSISATSKAFKSAVGSGESGVSVLSGLTLPADLRSEYSARTIEALNQFSKYTRHTATDALDLRCEFDLPRFKNLTDTKPLSQKEDHQNYLWF